MIEADGSETGPRDVGAARRAVEARRERVAGTLQALEVRLVEEKEAIQDKLDVTRPVREYVRGRPLAAVGAAVGAGLLLGLVTARRKRRGAEPALGGEDRDAIHRWRRERRKRLLESAEEELPSFEPPPSRLGRLVRDMAHEIAGAGTALLIAQLVGRVQEEGPELEYEDGPDHERT